MPCLLHRNFSSAICLFTGNVIYLPSTPLSHGEVYKFALGRSMTTFRRAPRPDHPAEVSAVDHWSRKSLSEDGQLGQFEILEGRGIAEHDQDGAASLRRMGTMSRVRFDVEFRTLRVRNAIVYEVTIQDIRRLGCLFVQVPWNSLPVPFSGWPPLGQRTDHHSRF